MIANGKPFGIRGTPTAQLNALLLRLLKSAVDTAANQEGQIEGHADIH
jgi:hypothetical protein